MLKHTDILTSSIQKSSILYDPEGGLMFIAHITNSDIRPHQGHTKHSCISTLVRCKKTLQLLNPLQIF